MARQSPKPSAPGASCRARPKAYEQPDGRRAKAAVGKRSGNGMEEVAREIREDRDKALAMFNLCAETIARLDRYVELLLIWQQRTNLIAPSTISTLWTRHVADSLQLLDLVDAPYAKPRVWLDLGSGGGFPAMIIASALANVPGTQVHMVESNLKKAAFLREAVRATGAPGMVHAVRIESTASGLGEIEADYVTARALAPLPDLLDMVAPFLKKGAKALLLKGQDLDHELTESTKRWHIETEAVPSRTSKDGRILIVHSLSKRFHLSPARSGEQDGP